MSFLYALLAAEQKDQNTMSYQQITDAITTQNNASMEEAIYQQSNAQLKTDASAVSKFINSHQSMSTSADTATLQQLNVKYQSDSTQCQTYQNTADSTVQASQTQVGQDGQNLANKAQLVQTMLSISSTMSSLLMQHY